MVRGCVVCVFVESYRECQGQLGRDGAISAYFAKYPILFERSIDPSEEVNDEILGLVIPTTETFEVAGTVDDAILPN